jgi:solute carrier family 25 (mitochondrial iron transporter), member 28/37
MVSYRQCKQELTPYLGEAAFSNYVVSGAVAEITSSFIWTPMEVLKGRMQIKEGQTSGSTYQLVKQIYRNEGVRGYFRGYWMGIAVFLPHSVVWWTTYEQAKTYFSKEEDLGPLEYGVSSAVASTSAAIASNFLDVVKTRQQLAVAEEISCLRPDDQVGVFRVARNLIKEVGFFRALFKGLHIRLTHSLPTSVLAMVIVESINPDSSKIKEVRVMDDLEN